MLFNENAADEVDSWDSEKMMSTNMAQCYTSNNEGDMAINSMAPLTGTKSVPVNIYIPTTGSYSFKSGNTESFSAATTITSEDKTSNTFADLKANQVYPFTSNAGTFTNRFVVHFNRASNGISSINSKESSIYSFENTVYVNALNTGIIEITDLTGRTLVSQSATTGMNTIKLNSDGVYMVKLECGNDVKVEKVFVR